jgi:hypothetical protein
MATWPTSFPRRPFTKVNAVGLPSRAGSFAGSPLSSCSTVAVSRPEVVERVLRMTGTCRSRCSYASSYQRGASAALSIRPEVIVLLRPTSLSSSTGSIADSSTG